MFCENTIDFYLHFFINDAWVSVHNCVGRPDKTALHPPFGSRWLSRQLRVKGLPISLWGESHVITDSIQAMSKNEKVAGALSPQAIPFLS